MFEEFMEEIFAAKGHMDWDSVMPKNDFFRAGGGPGVLFMISVSLSPFVVRAPSPPLSPTHTRPQPVMPRGGHAAEDRVMCV